MDTRWELTGGGVLTCTDDGPRVRLEAVRKEDGGGLYKVWLKGERGGRCLLGTMAPEGGRLALRRTLSKGGLTQCSCWPLCGGEAVLAFHFTQNRDAGDGWKPLRPGQVRLSDKLLEDCLRGNRAVLVREQAGGFQLAVLFDPKQPVALAPLFCLGEVGNIQGRAHLIWSFDSRGIPLLPHNASSFGTR